MNGGGEKHGLSECRRVGGRDQRSGSSRGGNTCGNLRGVRAFAGSIDGADNVVVYARSWGGVSVAVGGEDRRWRDSAVRSAGGGTAFDAVADRTGLSIPSQIDLAVCCRSCADTSRC